MATTNQIDLVGIEVPLRFKVGEAIVIPVSVKDTSGTNAVNITGRVYTAQIGAIGASSVTATLLKSNADDVNGTFELTLSASLSAALTKGRYYWELWENDRFIVGGHVEIVEKKFTSS